MPWAKIDDGLHAHPKIMAASLEAVGLYALALSHCAAYLTDGVVSGPWVRAICAARELELGPLTSELERCGLWDPHPDGWEVHDYLAYNPSRKDVEAERRRRTTAGRKAAKARWNGSP